MHGKVLDRRNLRARSKLHVVRVALAVHQFLPSLRIPESARDQLLPVDVRVHVVASQSVVRHKLQGCVRRSRFVRRKLHVLVGRVPQQVRDEMQLDWIVRHLLASWTLRVELHNSDVRIPVRLPLHGIRHLRRRPSVLLERFDSTLRHDLRWHHSSRCLHCRFDMRVGQHPMPDNLRSTLHDPRLLQRQR